MKTLAMILAAAAAGALASGCGWFRDESPGAPRVVVSGANPSVTRPPVDDVESARPPSAPAEATVAKPTPKGPAAPATRPDQPSKYVARLDEVDLPIPKGRPPVLAGVDGADGAPRLVNTVLAQVNGEVVTREDILGPLRPQMQQWRKEGSPDAFESRCREVVDLRLREAISRRLVVQEAKARLSDKEKEEIDAAVEQDIKDMISQAGSAMLLEEKLKRDGSSIAEERTRGRERLTVQRFLRERVIPRIHVTHSELLDHYQRVRDARYREPTRVRLGLVAIRKSEYPDLAQARAVADAVHQRARGGEDFARLAERYSRDPMAEKGGDWGFVAQGAFRIKPVDNVLFALPAGQVGPLVETDDAFYVVKALDRQEARTVPFTEVQDALEDELRDRRYNETASKYIQSLYEKGYVRVMLENL